MFKFIGSIAACIAALSSAMVHGQDRGEIKFETHRVGNFRSEACGVGDFNGDGKLDIVAGPYLYLNSPGEKKGTVPICAKHPSGRSGKWGLSPFSPVWKTQKIRELSGHVDDQGKGYYDDFANAVIDVDGDGRPDVISCSWFDKRSVWYRNTGEAEGLWPMAVIEENGNFETGDLWDLLGTGRKDVFVPVVQRTVWYELVKRADGTQGFTPRVVSEKPHAWGLGVGDVNGDGRNDILRPDAWFEAPADVRGGQWIEHPWGLADRDVKINDMAQMWTLDVNGDGRNDVLCSSAHDYGLYWYEQPPEKSDADWKLHVIDQSWSQVHSLELADLDGDGAPELIAGKRFMAHNGSDPGEFEPLGVYYYRLKPGPEPAWTKYAITYDQGIGSGMNIVAADLNGDGRMDIVTTGKYGGPVWFENQGKGTP